MEIQVGGKERKQRALSGLVISTCSVLSAGEAISCEAYRHPSPSQRDVRHPPSRRRRGEGMRLLPERQNISRTTTLTGPSLNE
jgi:hypothetical protein